jgi:hypothetical protein
MFAKLQSAVNRLADKLLMRTIHRLAAKPIPPGVVVKARPDGIELSGKRLKIRMINDIELRNIGK